MARNTPDPGFFDVPRHTVRLSAGEVELPITYTDASSTTVFYSVTLSAAQAMLAPHGLSPARILGRGALLAITWFEYRATSIGSYNELGLALLATPGRSSPVLPLVRVLAGDSRLGFFVLHLPVTTELARAGGVELYGYPKTVCELPITLSADRVEGKLVDSGAEVFRMSVPLARGLELRMIDLVTYSSLEGHLMRTTVSTDCRARVFRATGTTLEIRSPDHPIARSLTALGLPREPALVLHVPEFRSRLPWPELVERGTPSARGVGSAHRGDAHA